MSRTAMSPAITSSYAMGSWCRLSACLVWGLGRELRPRPHAPWLWPLFSGVGPNRGWSPLTRQLLV